MSGKPLNMQTSRQHCTLSKEQATCLGRRTGRDDHVISISIGKAPLADWVGGQPNIHLKIIALLSLNRVSSSVSLTCNDVPKSCVNACLREYKF